MLSKLQALWKYAPEKVGLILLDHSIVELENIHPDPWHNFQLEPSGFEKTYLHYPCKVKATWHTHPLTSANLSVEDYLLFLHLPERWFHYIISKDEVRCYYTQAGKVLLVE